MPNHRLTRCLNNVTGWLVGWLCLTSHRQRGHLETAPPFTVHWEGWECRVFCPQHDFPVAFLLQAGTSVISKLVCQPYFYME